MKVHSHPGGPIVRLSGRTRVKNPEASACTVGWSTENEPPCQEAGPVKAGPTFRIGVIVANAHACGCGSVIVPVTIVVNAI
jgi:hypothetical protein